MSDKFGDFTPVIKVELKRADVQELVRTDKVLATAPLVTALGPLAPRAFARAIARRYASKAVVFGQGDTGDSLLFVISGEVRLFARKDADSVELGSARPGEVFGEGQVLDGTSIRRSSAVAQGEVELAELARGSLLENNALPLALKRYLDQVAAKRNKALDELTDFINRW